MLGHVEGAGRECLHSCCLAGAATLQTLQALRAPRAATPRTPPRPHPAQMRVDTARREDLHVTFNVTFPALPCEAILMDSGDVSGKWQTESSMAAAKCAGASGWGAGCHAVRWGCAQSL